MSFEDELRGVIQTARSERQRWEREGKEFEAQWLRLRDSAILGIFREAEHAFSEEQINAEAKFNNGGIVLGVIRNDPREQYRYTFRINPDKETRAVILSSSIPGSEDDPFTLERLSLGIVREKIKQFADHIVRGDAPRLSVVT
jgi:hypothetical protein